MDTKMSFRIDTIAFLNEIVNNALGERMGVLKIPLNIFKNLLGAVAERATELNDPILNKIMFDLSLYELPNPTSKEYGILMRKVYKAAEKQRKQEAKKSNNVPTTKKQ